MDRVCCQDNSGTPRLQSLISETPFQVDHGEPHERIAVGKVGLKMRIYGIGYVGIDIIDPLTIWRQGGADKFRGAACTRANLNDANFGNRVRMQSGCHCTLNSESGESIDIVAEWRAFIDPFNQAQRTTRE